MKKYLTIVETAAGLTITGLAGSIKEQIIAKI
jgi:hypothetical protein